MAGNGSPLNKRQQRFIEAYASCQNGTKAALEAGYTKLAARQTASRLLTLPAVKSALQARGAHTLARLQVTEDMVLQELAAIAFSNIKRFTRWTKDGELVVLDSADIPDSLACAIESVEEQTLTSSNKDGSRNYVRVKRRVKLYSKLDALGKLAEYLGLTDDLAPRVTVHLVTGITRDAEQLPAKAIDLAPEGKAGP